MAIPHGTPIWYELITGDVPTAKRFYDHVFGWTIEAEATNPMGYRMIDTGTGLVGGVMPLSPEMEAGGGRPGWFFYVGVDDVDATTASVTAAGGSVHMPPMTMEGVGRMALLADPQGAPFYVMRGESDEASTAFHPGEGAEVGHAVWNELTARDQAAAIGFYRDQLGWRQEGGMPMGELGEYSFLHAGPTCIGAAMPELTGNRPGWLFYYQTADIDDAAARVTEGGGTIIQPPMEIPGGSFSAVAEDPEGLRFGLVGPKTQESGR